MFEVLLQYFEDSFASFYVNEPLSNYQDLLDRVKKAVPFLEGVDEQQIVLSYKRSFLQYLSILTGTRVYMSPKLLATPHLMNQTFTDESI